MRVRHAHAPAHRQRGVALITVLLVVALATAAAAAMTGEQQFDIRRTGNRIALNQAHQIALGGEAWAMGILARDRRGEDKEADEAAGAPTDQDTSDTPRNIDSRDEDWARTLAPIPIEGGQVTGRITDAEGRFNLNGLVRDGRVDAVRVARFERLLAVLGIDPQVAQAVIDWLDPDRETTYPKGAEDDYYAGLDTPYRAANRPLTSASELRLVRGIDGPAWRALAPYVTALPTATPINVNTASAPVLRALVPELDDAAAKQLVELAGEKPFTTVEAFLQHPLVAQAGDPPEASGLAVASSHFRVRTDVRMGSLEYTLYSWLARDDNGASRVLRRARTPN